MLPDIPNEVYLEIFKYLRPHDPDVWIDDEMRQVFCSLALVCRFFSSVMLPWIFENLSVSLSEKDQTNLSSSSFNSAKFCRSILDGNPTAVFLSKYVKRWAFEGSSDQPGWSSAFFSMYFEALPLMPNLCELELSDIVITKDLFRRLPNIPRLETLQLIHCAFDDSVHDKHLKKFTSVRLKKLTIHEHHQFNPNLHRLLPYVDMTSLLHMEHRLFTTNLGTLTMTGGLPLEYLNLSAVSNSLDLLEFLKSTPSLKVLRLNSSYTWPTSILESNYIPLLVELEACWSFCKFVIPGRPISCLRLTGPRVYIPADESGVIKRSTRPITHLRIQVEFIFCALFLDYFPDLKKLEIEMYFVGHVSPTWDNIVCWLAEQCPHHPHLQNFYMEFHVPEFNFSLEIDSIWQRLSSILTSAFPSLVTAEFYLRNTGTFCKYTLVHNSWIQTVDLFH